MPRSYFASLSILSICLLSSGILFLIISQEVLRQILSCFSYDFKRPYKTPFKVFIANKLFIIRELVGFLLEILYLFKDVFEEWLGSFQ